MTTSPADPTPYEVLGVSATVSEDELRRAYRRALRTSHPDTGGSSAAFDRVQRAWERVGTPESRAAFDRGTPSSQDDYRPAREQPRANTRAESRPGTVRARSYGHPGGLSRERYLSAIREWVGLGDPIPDPYAPGLVHSAPAPIRRYLAEAIAEEWTARIVGTLGIGYTIWNDVAADRGREKVDHLVLGPGGLFAIASEDWGGPVKLARGEITGPSVPEGEAPLRQLGAAAKSLARQTGVRFTANIIVVPDDAFEEPWARVQRGRTSGSIVVRRSLLPQLLRDGVAGERVSIEDAFEVRTRLQEGVRFV